MKTHYIDRLVAVDALRTVSFEGELRVHVIGHDLMGVAMRVASDGWFRLTVDGKTWGSLPPSHELEAVQTLFSLTLESAPDWAVQYVADLLSGARSHNCNPA